MTPPTPPESQHLDRKSLRLVTGAQADLQALAQDCVCFANGAGGQILIGIEDADQRPRPSSASIPPCSIGSASASASSR